VALLIVNSHVPHGLGDGQYEVRVKQCAEAVGVLRLRWPSITKLRDASIEQLNAVEAMMDETAFYRARHVITENERTQQAAQLLSAGNYNMLGKLMTFSHVSMKNDYEISVDNIDALVDAALELPGVYGSRLTGGGFGGQKHKTTTTTAHKRHKQPLAEACCTRSVSGFCFWWDQLSS
jgi:galactokinase